jgi:hypothetical protein
VLDFLRRLSTPAIIALSAGLVLLGALLVTYLPQLRIIHGEVLFSDSIYAGLSLFERLQSMLYHWDAKHYLQIATEGHGASETLLPFFPLYAWLLGLFQFSGPALPLLGTVISALAFAVALYYWRRIFQTFGFEEGVLFLAFYPAVVFCYAPYPESLFIALLGICVWNLHQVRIAPLVVAMPLFLLSKHAAVPVGGALLLWSWFYWPRRNFWAFLAISALSLALVLAYYHLAFGDPLAWLTAQKKWGRGFAMPWVFVANLHGKGVDAVLYVLWCFVAPIYLLRKSLATSPAERRKWTLAFVAASAILVPLWFGTSAQSIYRIPVLATPSLLVFSGLSPRAKTLWLGIFFVLLLNTTYMFVGGSHLP